jgi:hypothetical protein
VSDLTEFLLARIAEKESGITTARAKAECADLRRMVALQEIEILRVLALPFYCHPECRREWLA